MARQGRVEELAGRGQDDRREDRRPARDGSIPAADKLKARIPSGLVAVTRIPGLGPKRARLLYEHLGVTSLDDLRAAADAGPAHRTCPASARRPRRTCWRRSPPGRTAAQKCACCCPRRWPWATSWWRRLRDHPAALQRGAGGQRAALRRRRQGPRHRRRGQRPRGSGRGLLRVWPRSTSCSSSGRRAPRPLTHSGLPVDLRIVPEEAFGNLLQHFTGSGRHNEALRTRRGQARPARERVRHRRRRERRTARLRHRGGGLRAARHAAGSRPSCARTAASSRPRARIELPRADRAGATSAATCTCTPPQSDGHASIEEMAETARERGYDYVAITDHSATHGFGNDVQPDELLRQAERIRGARAGRHPACSPEPRRTCCWTARSTTTTTCSSSSTGSIASLHTSFRLSEKEQTERMLRAMEHPLVDAIGHPTGRLIERREPYAIDIDRVIAAGRRDRHVPRDQRQPGPARPQRRVRQGGRRGRSHARDRLRRPLAAHAGEHALRGGHRAPGLAHRATPWPTRGPGPSCIACASADGARPCPAPNAAVRARSCAARAGAAAWGHRRARSAVEPELHTVAALDRLDRARLVAPQQRDEQAVAGGHGRHLRKEEADHRRGQRQHDQRPEPVEQHGSGLELRQRVGLARVGQQAAMPGVVIGRRPSQRPASVARHHQTAAT